MQAIKVDDVDLFIPRGFQLKKTLPADRERVFKALTDPEAVQQWFRPTPEHSVKFVTVNLRKNSRFKIGLQHPGGEMSLFAGVYTELRPPEKLVFTWSLGGGGTHQERSLVAIRLDSVNGKTELTLSHGLFLKNELKEEHRQLWEKVLNALEKYLQSGLGVG